MLPLKQLQSLIDNENILFFQGRTMTAAFSMLFRPDGRLCDALWTLSGLIQMLPKNGSFLQAKDLPCFPFRAAVFIRLKSLFAARFKLYKLSLV